jgi:hypothetical protein
MIENSSMFFRRAPHLILKFTIILTLCCVALFARLSTTARAQDAAIVPPLNLDLQAPQTTYIVDEYYHAKVISILEDETKDIAVSNSIDEIGKMLGGWNGQLTK